MRLVVDKRIPSDFSQATRKQQISLYAYPHHRRENGEKGNLGTQNYAAYFRFVVVVGRTPQLVKVLYLVYMFLWLLLVSF